jgi:putative endonuclease
MTAPHLLMGRKGERLACRFLWKHGFDILARRFRASRGEIDLIALEGEVLVFIEVKTRASSAFGDPWESVGWEKKQSLQAAAEEFIARYDLGQYAYRFDIISVVAPATPQQEIHLFRNAF